MTTQPIRSVQPGHISTAPAVEVRDTLGHVQPFLCEPHGLCVCAYPRNVSAWGECQRCHRPVLASVRVRP